MSAAPRDEMIFMDPSGQGVERTEGEAEAGGEGVGGSTRKSKNYTHLFYIRVVSRWSTVLDLHVCPLNSSLGKSEKRCKNTSGLNENDEKTTSTQIGKNLCTTTYFNQNVLKSL